MKVRSDFVANSSSSSFILARKGGLNDRQREALIDFVEKYFLGRIILSPDCTEDEVQRVFGEDWEFKHNESLQDEVKNALENGMSVYQGAVIFEDLDYSLSDIYESIWRLLENNADAEHAFVALDDDLSY